MTCWKKHLWPALDAKKNELPIAAVLIGKISGAYFTLEDIEQLGAQHFKEGQPVFRRGGNQSSVGLSLSH